MKLRELTENSQKSEIISFFEGNSISPDYYTIRNDDRVDVSKHDCVIVNIKDGNVPVKFGKMKENLSIVNAGIKSFGDWMPEEATRVSLKTNKLSSFEGLSGINKVSHWHLENNEFTNLHNIHKHIPKAISINLKQNDIQKNILGVCLIEGLTSFCQRNPISATKNMSGIQQTNDGRLVNDEGEVFERMSVAFWIVAKYLNQGNAGVVKAQRELIDLDLDDYADV